MQLSSLRFKSNIFFVIAFLLIVLGATAQETTEKKKVVRPDIPGQFLIDWGVNGTRGAPPKFRKGWFGSRTINLYYYYPFRIGKSKFSVDAGIGLGIDRFKFTNYYYLADTSIGKRYDLIKNYQDKVAPVDSTRYPSMKKSFLSMTYLDVPVQIKYSVNPSDPNHTFWIAVGGRAGFLAGANTKIKNKVDGDKMVHKEKYNYGLSKLRYGVTLRMGIGNFNFFGFYNLSPLFEKGKGPSATKMTDWTIGISLIGL